MNKVMNNLKNLCNSTLNELVNENVITLYVPTKFKNPNGSNTFGVFLCYKIRICQKDTVENRSKIRVLVKNLN